jgi:hypothetical protein
MTRALVEDSTGRLFDRQSTSHYSQIIEKGENTCFLAVVPGGWSATRKLPSFLFGLRINLRRAHRGSICTEMVGIETVIS